jgi:hypothetical protein
MDHQGRRPADAQRDDRLTPPPLQPPRSGGEGSFATTSLHQPEESGVGPPPKVEVGGVSGDRGASLALGANHFQNGNSWQKKSRPIRWAARMPGQRMPPGVAVIAMRCRLALIRIASAKRQIVVRWRRQIRSRRCPPWLVVALPVVAASPSPVQHHDALDQYLRSVSLAAAVLVLPCARL